MSGFGGSYSRLSVSNMSFRKPRRGSSHVNLPEVKGSAKSSSRVKVMNLKPLEEMVTCPIDLNFLEDPRLLPCGHVFCRQCLDSYLRQILSYPTRGAPNPPQLPCPICRALHVIPESHTAGDFPKSFNHNMVLDYIRSQAIVLDPSELGAFSIGPSSSRSSFHNPSPLGFRKASMNVTSDALDCLVADITAIKRSGSSTILDLATLLHEVRRLAESSETQQQKHLPGLLGPEIPKPSAPPAPPTPRSSPITRKRPPPQKQQSDSSRRSSGGRFHRAANNALGLSSRGSCRSDAEVSSYATYRELLLARTIMMKNSEYSFLRKALGQCGGFSSALFSLVCMHLLPNRGSTHVMQYTIGLDVASGVLELCRKMVSIHPGRESFTIAKTSTRSPEKNPDTVLRQCWSLDDIANMGKLEVQYVRFFKKRVYMTVIVRQLRSEVGLKGDTPLSPDLVDPGMVICCALPDPNEKFTPEDLSVGDSGRKKFPIIDASSIFLRDVVGMNQLDRPTIAGLDVDRATGAVYVALCANAMICRLNPENLKQVDREWFLNEPQLSPSYLCIAKHENEVWASCPFDDKVFILDLTTDTFDQFTPSVMFNIKPSHIVCTTDDRIMLLDKKLSRIYWLKRVQQSICSQRIDDTMKERRCRGIDIIQPVDDILVSDCLATSRLNPLCGGLMCADKEGSYIIYPRKVLSKRLSSSIFCCL